MGSNQLGVRPEDDFLDLSKVSESGVSSKESAIEYIREEPLPFKIPPYEGDRYETWAPDTLDLAERAELGINGLTGPTDPEADYEVYWQVNFFPRPAGHVARCGRCAAQVYGSPAAVEAHLWQRSQRPRR